MISYGPGPAPKDTLRRAKLPKLPPGVTHPVIQLSEPTETLIIPANKDRIDADIGPDNTIKRLIIYVRRRPRDKKRRFRWLRRK